jgi:hypothetical protein
LKGYEEIFWGVVNLMIFIVAEVPGASIILDFYITPFSIQLWFFKYKIATTFIKNIEK